MEPFKKFFLAVRFIGLRQVLRTVAYTGTLARLETRFPTASQTPAAKIFKPEALISAAPAPRGAAFKFKHGIELQVEFLGNTAVRLTWKPGELPVPYAVVEDGWEDVPMEVDEGEDGWRVSSEGVTLLVGGNGRLRYFKGEELFREEAPPSYQAPIWRQSAALDEHAHLYGLGERSRFNLRGGRYRLWNTDPDGSYGHGEDPLYMSIPAYTCLQPGGGYLIFYENSFDGEIGFEDQAEAVFLGGALRYVVFAEGPPEALHDYTRLTGRAPLPPRWVLGFHQSRWSYETEAEVREVAEGFKRHDLPLAAIHLDIDYMRGYRVFSVDKTRFPDLKGLTTDLEAGGIKTVTILDPGVKWDPGYDVFREGRDQGVFCQLPDGKTLRGLVWPGWAVYPDFTHPAARRWWGGYYRRLVSEGVAGFWHDMNEPAAFTAGGADTVPRATVHEMDGRKGIHEEGHNLYGLLMNRAGFEALRELQPEKRPWLLTRSGWAGVQRYAWKWSGDVESSWEALRMTVGTLLSTGVSGIPYSGSDIGGFSGSPSEELFVRWFQMAAFTPFFRNHAAKGTARSEPWVFGEPALSICREFLRLRRRLLPYLYTLGWEASQTGAPLMRPVWWRQPEERVLWDIEDAFLLGDALLVAPVVERGATERRVRLPTGRWYSFWDDEVVEGGRESAADTPLERIPVFVRAGSVIPMAPDIHGEGPKLHIYPPAGEGSGSSAMYCDAGEGYGDMRVDRFEVGWEGGELVVKRESEGEYGGTDDYGVVVHGVVAGKGVVDGKGIETRGGEMRTGPFTELRIATDD